MSQKLIYKVARGKDVGMILRPHKYKDGFFALIKRTQGMILTAGGSELNQS